MGSFGKEDELRGELIGALKEEFILFFKCGVRQDEVLTIQLLFTVDTQFHCLAHRFELFIKWSNKWNDLISLDIII